MGTAEAQDRIWGGSLAGVHVRSAGLYRNPRNPQRSRRVGQFSRQKNSLKIDAPRQSREGLGAGRGVGPPPGWEWGVVGLRRLIPPPQVQTWGPQAGEVMSLRRLAPGGILVICASSCLTAVPSLFFPPGSSCRLVRSSPPAAQRVFWR